MITKINKKQTKNHCCICGKNKYDIIVIDLKNRYILKYCILMGILKELTSMEP